MAPDPDLITEPPRSGNAINALIHLYRAEVGRMTTYRQRLDTTTNWAITSAALVTTFAIANPLIPHTAFLFLMIVTVFFLWVEARRFTVYEAARYRVLLLEHYFYPEVLGDAVPRDWTKSLLEALKTPHSFPAVGALGAVGWRLRRNYLWIYFVVFLTWVAKLQISAQDADLIGAAAIGPIPGWLVWLVVIVFYIAIAAIGLFAHRTYPMGHEAAWVLRQEPD